MAPDLFRVPKQNETHLVDFSRELGVSSYVAQALLRRDICTVDAAQAFLHPRLSDLSRPIGLADLEVGVERLIYAIRNNQRIVVFGDYDVDGTTSAALLTEVIEVLGGTASVTLASRFDGGYGLSTNAAARVQALCPDLVVTCDCGSSDHAAIDDFQRRGVDVIVIDHHRLPDPRPTPLALINPQRADCAFNYKSLTSVGLAFMVAAWLRSKLRPELDMRIWLDLVALGTIADVAPLDGDNRRLVRAGLSRLSRPDLRPGLSALNRLAGFQPGTSLGAMDVAFQLAPRLNAAGRMGDPSVTCELLRSNCEHRAADLGSRVDSLNRNRQQIERDISRQAFEQLEQVYELASDGVVVASEAWHVGVIGIVAARILERVGSAVVVIAFDAQGVGVGSCRSDVSVSLPEVLSLCADYLQRWGGHARAAGLQIEVNQLAAFRKAFSDAVRSVRTQGEARAKSIDFVYDPARHSLPSTEELKLLEPLGEANPEPLVLFPAAHLQDADEVGQGHLRGRVRIGDALLRAFGPHLAESASLQGSAVETAAYLRTDKRYDRTALTLHLVAIDRPGTLKVIS